MTFTLPNLNYKYNALEPYFDRKTMSIHHKLHHRAYVDNLNNLLKDVNKTIDYSLVDILLGKHKFPKSLNQGILNNAGGHINHSLFWITLSPGRASKPETNLLKLINTMFGSKNNMLDAIIDSGMKRFGSGWAWLVINKKAKLEVISTPNQDNPISLGARPILGVDVWEHAYYLKYQNRRKDYLEAWKNIINWPIVSQIFNGKIKINDIT